MITGKELADRLGVDRSAISKAIARGRLRPEADGTIDLDQPGNAAYVSRFSKHRGKRRTEPASPERAEAARRRALATFDRASARFHRRRADGVPFARMQARETAFIDALVAGIRELPDRVNFAAESLERELERAVSAAISAALAAPASPPPSDGPEPEPIPARLGPETPLDEIRARIDMLHAARHDLEGALESGEVITREQVRRNFALLNERIGILRSLPRRQAQPVAAVVETGGPEAARRRLREIVETEIERIERREN